MVDTIKTARVVPASDLHPSVRRSGSGCDGEQHGRVHDHRLDGPVVPQHSGVRPFRPDAMSTVEYAPSPEVEGRAGGYFDDLGLRQSRGRDFGQNDPISSRVLPMLALRGPGVLA